MLREEIIKFFNIFPKGSVFGDMNHYIDGFKGDLKLEIPIDDKHMITMSISDKALKIITEMILKNQIKTWGSKKDYPIGFEIAENFGNLLKIN